jgi:YD repeat-containing protein
MISLQVNAYDGLGRLLRETTGFVPKRTNAYTYDPYNRLLEHTLPEGAKVFREYADHSSGDLPTVIKVSGVVMGLQAFDGLDRRISATTGGRVTTYQYEQGERQPKTVHTPMGDIEYKYELRLSEEPKERAFIDVGKQGGTPQRSSESLFERNKRNARLEACSVGEEAFFREHYTNGTLHKERRHQGGQDYAMTYGHSQRGRETFFKDVNDNCQTYLYGNEPGTPAHGQLVSTEIAGVLQGTFEYDDFARMANYTTTDTVGNQSIETLLAYDPFDREIQRTFIFTDNGQRTQQTLVQEYDDRDAMTKRTLTQNLPLPEKLLRQEKYGYDLDQRLTSYECEGPECPLDPAGNVIRSQTFIHDVYNNIEVLITERVGGPGEFSIYHFSAVDPAQLVAIESLPFAANVKLFGLSREQALRLFDAAPPQHRRRIELEYDANGNLTRDEQGRVMEYDRFNRLLKVTVPAADGELVEAQAYGYDGTDILTRTTQANRTEQRFYQSGNASVVGDITIVRGAGGQPLAESQPTEAAQHSVQDPSP